MGHWQHYAVCSCVQLCTTVYSSAAVYSSMLCTVMYSCVQPCFFNLSRAGGAQALQHLDALHETGGAVEPGVGPARAARTGSSRAGRRPRRAGGGGGESPAGKAAGVYQMSALKR